MKDVNGKNGIETMKPKSISASSLPESLENYLQRQVF